ncbi:L-aspartate oxidase [Sunxiuqinia dokdonensis]|uniref:L-aspartate oxidase n=1 Tax=Sunxiuqinia dokdonensis TaxID=1409788 RepID=A0A0L8V366_9BACT|nr:L-aspartate oxidase [Sunxiuqinia dokdonensis]KOH42854.1 aspartate oxidase [Sunxiuqinia dokdonensis]
MQVLDFDTLVIGSGLAGLSAAYHASKYGTVAIITKSQLDTSNSYYAQGGIAAAIDPEDSPELHLHDTMVAGRGLCEEEAVKVLVTEGRQRILELIDMGMKFDQMDGNYVLGLEGGHSKRRILHAGGDATGKEITCFMLQKVKEQNNIRSFEYAAVTELIIKNGQCVGVQAIDFQSGENVIFRSKASILATGGLSRLFSRTTNPHTATGDGIALAYDAGAQLADMEFIQFHPSALFLKNQDAFLISEAVRGEGAWLLNTDGERFMKDIHPLAELAPRDIVAFSIYKQMQKQNSPHIYLSMKHLDAAKTKTRFSTIYNKLKEFGYDMTSDLLPIAPAAHYMVGGIKTDLNGETNIPGLFACGEVASTGVMGANRLASNSLLECLVFGKRASEQAAKRKPNDLTQTVKQPLTNDITNEQAFLETKNDIADLMSQKVGIVRTGQMLRETIEQLEAIGRKIPKTITDYNELKARHIQQICLLIAQSALLREESRGGHIREDFQHESPDFRLHIIQQKNQEPFFIPIKK